MTATITQTMLELSDSGNSYVLVARLRDNLDAASEQQARKELTTACDALAERRWMLLLAGRSLFVDVRGLNVLESAARRCTAAGRGFIVISPPRSLRRMVDALGGQSELTLAETPWDAAALMDRRP